MAYRLVYTEFWQDAVVMEEMTPEDKYFYLYLLTNPNTNMVGIYQITKKQIAFELGYSIESVNSLMDRFEKHHNLIKYDPKTREIFIRKYAKYNLNKGGKPVEDCIKKELEKIKNIEWLTEVIDLIPNKGVKSLIINYIKDKIKSFDDTSYDTSYDKGGNQNQNQNQNQKNEPNEGNSSNEFRNLKLYNELGFGTINPTTASNILSLEEEYSEKWVELALKEADYNGSRKLSYVEGILKKWKISGVKSKIDKPKGEENKQQELSLEEQILEKVSDFDFNNKPIGIIKAIIYNWINIYSYSIDSIYAAIEQCKEEGNKSMKRVKEILEG